MFKRGVKTFVPFLVAGAPSLAVTEAAIDILVDEGAGAIELGVPYSDALADGPVIQAASEFAAKVIRLSDVFSLADRVRRKYPELPLILFTYFNPLLRRGLATFAREAKAAGITAVLVVDLPPEEAEEYLGHMCESGLETVFLASPTTAPERLSVIARASSGFVYYVSRVGVTGEQSRVSESLAAEVQRLRQYTDAPIAVGFGISSGEQAAEVANIADAIVVGSAFVRILGASADTEKNLFNVRQFARELVRGIRTRM